MTPYSLRKKLADGSFKTYHYAYRGGPRLFEEPGTQAFKLEMKMHRQHSYETEPGTLAELIEDYRGSAKYQQLKPITRRDYEKHLDAIKASFGPTKLALFEDRRMRKKIKKWRDLRASTPRMADYAVTVFKRLLEWGVDNGDLAHNVAARMEKLYYADRADIIWEPDEIAEFLSVASPALARAFNLARMTGLRRTDLCAITWAADKETHLSWVASKTGARVTIPVTDDLRALLNACKVNRGLTILQSPKGLPWRPDGLSTAFQRTRSKIPHCSKRWHDLRGTAATWMCRAGLEDREVAAILGWSKKSVEQIRRKYVSGEALILSAVARLNRENEAVAQENKK